MQTAGRRASEWAPIPRIATVPRIANVIHPHDVHVHVHIHVHVHAHVQAQGGWGVPGWVVSAASAPPPRRRPGNAWERLGTPGNGGVQGVGLGGSGGGCQASPNSEACAACPGGRSAAVADSEARDVALPRCAIGDARIHRLWRPRARRRGVAVRVSPPLP